MEYILLSEEFIIDNLARELENVGRAADEAEPVYESWDSFNRRTGNFLSKMLGGTEKCGRETFSKINKNVDALEKVIDDYNKQHKDSKVGSGNILELKIDKAKLDLSYLLSMTTLNTTSFIADVCTANILNFKILIRPIRNARIISLGYKYYLAIIRHTIQNALIALELASDTFFIQIMNGIKGQSKKTRDFIMKITDEVNDSILHYITSTSDDKSPNGVVSPAKCMTKQQIDYLQKQLKIATQQARTAQMSQYNDMRYTQNIYQEFGKQSESAIKQNQDKEIQTLGEQFNHLGNTINNEARDIVGNYAQMVKLSAESRAQAVCAKINMAMLDVMQMFSMKYIDGYIDMFEEMSMKESDKQKCDEQFETINRLKAELESENDKREVYAKSKVDEALNKKNMQERYSSEIKKHWEDRGIKKLFSPSEFNELCEGSNAEGALRKYMSKYKFDESQINLFISDNTLCVDDFDKAYTNGTLTGWVMNYKNDGRAQKMKERLLEHGLETIFTSEDFMSVCKQPNTFEKMLKKYMFTDEQVDEIKSNKKLDCSLFSPIFDNDDNVVGWKKVGKVEEKEAETMRDYVESIKKRGFDETGSLSSWKMFVKNATPETFKEYLVKSGFKDDDAAEVIDDEHITSDDFRKSMENGKFSGWVRISEEERKRYEFNEKYVNDVYERGFATIMTIKDFEEFKKSPSDETFKEYLIKYGFDDEQAKLITKSRKYRLSDFSEVCKNGKPIGYAFGKENADGGKENADGIKAEGSDKELDRIKRHYLERGLDRIVGYDDFETLFNKKPTNDEIMDYLIKYKFTKKQADIFVNKNSELTRDSYMKVTDEDGDLVEWKYITRQPSNENVTVSDSKKETDEE